MTMLAKWWTLTITSLIPKERKRERVISSSVRPPSSTRALGRLSVSGRRRVPRPAERIMAFIGGDSPRKEEAASGEWQVARKGKRERGGNAEKRGVALVCGSSPPKKAAPTTARRLDLRAPKYDS